MPQASCGSSLRSKRSFLFLFSQTDRWWSKYLKGYTHVVLIETTNQDYWVTFEPTFRGCTTTITDPIPLTLLTKDHQLLEVLVHPTRKNRLLKPTFLTCVTIVQYLANISLGCILAQTLYEKLTCKDIDWLGRQGITGVKQWAQKQQS